MSVRQLSSLVEDGSALLFAKSGTVLFLSTITLLSDLSLPSFHSCSQCAKKFTHRSTFKQHVLMHEGSKLYKCHVCSKAFVQSSNYRRHILTHKTKEERIQKCDLCGRELLSRRGFKNHRKRCVRMLVERANANEPKPKKPRLKSGEFHCEHCPRIFTYSRWLETHVAKKHTSPSAEGSALQSLKPTKAKDKRPRKANLKAPEVTANPRKNPRQAPVLPIQCSDCGRRFGYAERLKEHQVKVHQQAAVQGTSSPTGRLCIWKMSGRRRNLRK